MLGDSERHRVFGAVVDGDAVDHAEASRRPAPDRRSPLEVEQPLRPSANP